MDRRRFLRAAGAVGFVETLFLVSGRARALSGIAEKVNANRAVVPRHVALAVLPWEDDYGSIAEVAAVEVLDNGLSGKCCWADVSANAKRVCATSFFPTLLDFIGNSRVIVSDHNTIGCLRRATRALGSLSTPFSDNSVKDVVRFKAPTGHDAEVIELALTLPQTCSGLDEGYLLGNVALIYAEYYANLFIAETLLSTTWARTKGPAD